VSDQLLLTCHLRSNCTLPKKVFLRYLSIPAILPVESMYGKKSRCSSNPFMEETMKTATLSSSVKPVPAGYHTATPYLTIQGAATAIDFYKRAFGAKELFRMPGPDGKIMHAEITIGDSHIMLADESNAGETKAPQTLRGTATGIFLYLEDVDATFKQALKAGAKQTAALGDMFWGDRFGKLTDPFGHVWMLASHIEDVSPAEMQKRMAAASK
jgi:PhnB protein